MARWTGAACLGLALLVAAGGCTSAQPTDAGPQIDARIDCHPNASDCVGDSTCVIDVPTGSTRCVVPGTLPQSAPCGGDNGCAGGLQCVADGAVRQCERICWPGIDCGVRFQCSLELGIVIDGVPYGFCSPR